MKEGIYEQPSQKFPEAGEEQTLVSKLEAQPEHTRAPEEIEEFRGKEKTSGVTKTLFLTGATGFLGSHTAIELLRGGHKLIILARGAHEKTAPQRVEEALKKILTQAEYDKFADSIKVMEGDIKEKDLGLAKEQLQEIANRNIEILHLAANLNFGMEKREEVMSTNVGGTKNVLDFANKVVAKKFNFVSTAYVCGKKTGMVAEALVPESERPEFNNPYEESKYIAEQEVEMWRKKTNIPATIFRPSIIIKRGQTNNRSGYYAFASAFALLRQKIMIEDGRVKYPCNPNATLDLISVEDAAKYATRILEKENTTREMEIFHMTNPKSRTIGEIFADSLALMGLDRKVELVNDLNLTTPNFYKTFASQEVTKELVRILRDLTPYLFLNVN